MSMLGLNTLKIESTSSVIVTVDNVADRDLKFNDQDIMHENKITGLRIFGAKGDHLTISCIMHICKESDQYSIYDTLYTHYKTNVYVAPFGDNFILDSSGDRIEFFFKKCFLFNLATPDFKDGLNLEFISTAWVDINQSTKTVILDDLLREITDDLDRSISI